MEKEKIDYADKYIIVGCKVGEMEQRGELEFTADMDYEKVKELADKLYEEFKKDKSCEYFSEFVSWRLKEMQQEENATTTRYYVEAWFFSREDGDYPYLFQSKWYDTIEECYGFVNTFDFVDGDIRFSIMQAEFNKDGSYGDIDVYLEDMIREKGVAKK